MVQKISPDLYDGFCKVIYKKFGVKLKRSIWLSLGGRYVSTVDNGPS